MKLFVSILFKDLREMEIFFEESSEIGIRAVLANEYEYEYLSFFEKRIRIRIRIFKKNKKRIRIRIHIRL